MFGFHGRILTVDLASRSFSIETPEPGLLEAVLGGKGLGASLLLARNPVGVDPLGPENRLIFAAGPLCASPVRGGNRCGVFAKSPLTGGHGEAYADGEFPEALDRAGYDAVVVAGASEVPVAVSVHPEGCAFHEADHLWGLETPDAERATRSSLGVDRPGFGSPGAVVAGPAGERKVRCADIASGNRPWTGGAGMGAILGAKRLKAIVFQGDRGRVVADPEGLRLFAADFAGARDGAWRTRHAARSQGRPPCFVTRGRGAAGPGGRWPGLPLGGPGSVAMAAFGDLCGIEALGEIAWLDDLCGRMGLDTLATGKLCALAIEACRRGRLDLELTLDDFEGIGRLVRDIAVRVGAGDVLAEGLDAAAAEWGLSDAPETMRPAPGAPPGGFSPEDVPKPTQPPAEGEDRLAVFDLLLLCRRHAALYPWEALERVVSLVTGRVVNRKELQRKAARVLDLVRTFNRREGRATG